MIINTIILLRVTSQKSDVCIKNFTKNEIIFNKLHFFSIKTHIEEDISHLVKKN